MKYDALTPPDPAAWLEADENERLSACARYHRLKEPHPRAQSQRVHDVVHVVVVENQLAMGDPPEARAALERLLADGLDRHEAIHAIGSQLTDIIWKSLSKSMPVSDKEYSAKLQSLTAESWRREYAPEAASSDESEEGEAAPGIEDIAELISLLAHPGERLPDAIAESIADWGEELDPGLIDILEDEELANEDVPGGGYPPVHAATLLRDLNAVDAIGPMLKVLARDDEMEMLHNAVTDALK